MAKIIRYSLIVVVLLVLTLLAAPFFIDVNVYKMQIEKMAKDQTGRTLKIGNIKASLFPWLGVELRDVHLANRSGFSQDDFLSVERLHVRLALMPLLAKKVEIEHFELVSPVLHLKRRDNGENNWQDLIATQPTASLKPAVYVMGADHIIQRAHVIQTINTMPRVLSVAQEGASTAPASPMLAALKAESIRLTGGRVTWTDAGAAPVVLSDLDVNLEDVQLDRPVQVNISGRLADNAFALDAQLGPIGDLATLKPATLPVQGHFEAQHIQLKPFEALLGSWPAPLGDIATASADVSMNAEQRPNGIRLAEGALHVKAEHKLGLVWKVEMLHADQLKLNRIGLTVDGRDVLQAKGDVKGLPSQPYFHIWLDGQKLERTWLEAFVPDLKAMYAGHSAPWTSVKWNAALAGDAQALKLNDVQLMLDRELLKISGDVIYADPDIRLRIAGKQLHLDAWLPQAKEQQAKDGQNTNDAFNKLSIIPAAIASEAKEASIEPDLRFLKGWKIASQLKIKTLFMRGLEMGDFSATINAKQGVFKLNPLRFRLAGGKVSEKASLNVTTYPATWKESVHISGVQAGPLLKILASTDILQGRMDMDTKFHARGLTQEAVKTLNGRGTVLFQNGTLKGFDIAGAIRQFTNPAGYKAGPKETDFAQLSGSFDVRNGIAHNKDLFLASPLLRVTGKGIVNLVQKTMDYEVKPRVVASLKGQGGNSLRPGLSIPLRIYGPIDAPSVKPVINAKTILQNAPALLNKGVGGSLGKLLGGGKGQANPAPPSKSRTAEKQLLNNLGGLIPGL